MMYLLFIFLWYYYLMKNNDFAEHEFAVRHAASSTLRSHLDGTLDDQQEYGDGSSTGYR
jgi:hypothetical protein